MDNNESISDEAELLALERLLSDDDDTARNHENNIQLELSKDNNNKTQLDNATHTSAEANSSDDEASNMLDLNYNEFGSSIYKKLKHLEQEEKELKAEKHVHQASKEAEVPSCPTNKEDSSFINSITNSNNNHKKKSQLSTSFTKNVGDFNSKEVEKASIFQPSVYTDPVFGLRIINPLISSSLLIERMKGRQYIPLSRIDSHVQRGDLSKDWVMAGVLVSKSSVQMTKNNKPYTIFRLSDLKGDIKMVSLFLFNSAQKELWKTAEGTCIAVLNPNVFERRNESASVACFSIDTVTKVLVLGKSKDLGACKARKRNGDVCNGTVNLSECDTCVYHMKQEFGKMSKRSELQSPNAGRGLNELRNKVLGKSEVFYGGQSYTAVPARKSAKLAKKDSERLSALSEYAVSPFARSANHSSHEKLKTNGNVPYASPKGPVSKVALNLDATRKQRVKDLQTLEALSKETKLASNTEATPLPSPSPSKVDSTTEAVNVSLPTNFNVIPEKFKDKEFSFMTKSPQLSRENFSLEINISHRKAQIAKIKALEILKQKPLEKLNPNSTRGTIQGKRRAIDNLNDALGDSDSKRQKLEEVERSSRIQRIMAATSSHTNLVECRERHELDKTFSKLEKKEALEEKMLNTYKIPCKAVICQICKYTAFSAADRCKEERHKLKVIDAQKRFFQCKDCRNRTVTVFKFPKTTCNNCQSSRWERAPMIRERKITNNRLSIRGDEEMFIGSISDTANLNLMVPEHSVQVV